SMLRRSPGLERMWFDQGDLCGGFDAAGQNVLLGGISGYMLCNIASGQAVSRRVGQGHNRASLSPDGQRVVTGGGAANSAFTLWDVSSGRNVFDLRQLEGGGAFRGDCEDLQFSPDGRWIAAAVSDPEGRVVIWNAKTGHARRAINYADAANVGWTNGNTVFAARFDRSGTRLVTTGTDKRAVVWQWETGRATHVLQGHRSFVYSACFGQRHT